MKKIFITAILFSSLSFGAFADGSKKDNTNAEAISYTVLNQFSYDFKDATDVSWKIDGNCQKAEFVLEGKKLTAFYSLTGEYMGVTRPVAFKTVPASAQKEIGTQYTGYKVGEVIELQPKATAQSALSTYASSSSFNDDSKVYFVDLKNEKEEILVRVTTNGDVYFFKQVK